METLILDTRKTAYIVEKQNDGSISIQTNEGPVENAGNLILSMGGVDSVIDRCIKYNGTLQEYMEERRRREEAWKKERAERKKEHEERIGKVNQQRKSHYEEILKINPIPASIENIRTILHVLNNQNWGYWKLPALSIGYSVNQYDCDGTTATTITLDTPVSDPENGIINETKFKVGGKKGHLEKYRTL